MDLAALLLALENAMRSNFGALRTWMVGLRDNVQTHIDDNDNPHMVDKEQIGLGYLQNLPIATETQAQAGVSNHAYMTPLRVAQAIAVLGGGVGGGDASAHIANTSNPHAVTKTQVGLSAVLNYGIASEAQARAGVVNDAYMTPLRVAQAIETLAGASGDITAHTSNTSNPHAVTATQVGLGSVLNYPIASEAQARAGSINTAYMTPLRVAETIDTLVFTPLLAHTSNTSNPHSTTAAQVGLGSVMNFPIASQAEAAAGTNNATYMTPLRTAQAITALATGAITSHTSNTSNPHGVTKAQVGLSAVENYAVASQTDAQTGTATNLYMTPLRVAQAITALIGGTVTSVSNNLSTHISNTANPHAVTATQVGLGNVQNYGIASQTDAQTGTATNVYMTPLRVAQAITALVGNALTTHTSNTSNPHGVTATQVGLGSVLNYGIASQAEAEAGTATNRYMTPQRTAQAIAALGGAGGDITAHTSNTSNPHSVTAAQVGLGSVLNYGIASQAQAQAGTATNVYMTPLRTAEAITALIGGTVTTLSGNLSSHTSNVSNPHNTTATQVGLGSVSNYATATQAEAEAGTATNRFMTPQRTAQAITALVGSTVSTHVANTSNPHNTTAAQVGLGSVQNYGIASQAQAQAGTATNVYMTPLRVAEAITALIGGTVTTLSGNLSTHTANTSNPHSTTATQVGLGSVQNYGVASEVQARAGSAANLYMTPLRSYQLVDEHVFIPLAAVFSQAATDLA